MRRLPPLGAIQAFVHVARLGSLKAAAESLALSSPAVTRRVQALEQFIGATLFERQHNNLQLNLQGESLLAEIAPNIDALSSAIERASSPTNEFRLRLAVPSLFGSQQLVPALRGLRERYPDFHIDMDTGPNRLARLDEGVDAAIVIASEVDPKLYARLLQRDQIIVVGSRAFTQGEGALSQPSDLARVPVLLHRDMPSNLTAWQDATGHDQVRPTTINYYDSGQMILDAAAEGIGVAFMLRSHLQSSTDPRLVQIFDEVAESPYFYWFVCTKPGFTRRPVRMFHDWLFDTYVAH